MDEIEIVLEDLDELIELARKKYNIAGFLSIVHSANMIRGLLEKQVSKKPKEVDYDDGYFKCSGCGGLVSWLDSPKVHKYCLLCGQKIDWN